MRFVDLPGADDVRPHLNAALESEEGEGLTFLFEECGNGVAMDGEDAGRPARAHAALPIDDDVCEVSIVEARRSAVEESLFGAEHAVHSVGVESGGCVEKRADDGRGIVGARGPDLS